MESTNADGATGRKAALRWGLAAALAAVAGAVAAAVMVFDEPAREPVGKPGEWVYERGTVAWRLQESVCTYGALSEVLLNEGAITDARSAVVQQGGRTWPACWSEDADRDVLLVDVTGTSGFMPRAWFKPAQTKG